MVFKHMLSLRLRFWLFLSCVTILSCSGLPVDHLVHNASSNGSLSVHDFVLTMPVSIKHSELAITSRAWRGQVKAIFALDTEQVPEVWLRSAPKYNESFTYYPDYRMFPDNSRHHYTPGDRRLAMCPLLAYKKVGPTFKWLLLGDDDTIFFLHGLKQLLQPYDPELPYVVSNALLRGPSCIGCDVRICHPCHIPPPYPLPRKAPHCPCNSTTICALHSKKSQKKCLKEEGPVAWGGTGVAYSVGLFKMLEQRDLFGALEQCYNSTSLHERPAGGDAIMSRCLWRVAGVANTKPQPTKFGPHFGSVLTVESLMDFYSSLVAWQRSETPSEPASYLSKYKDIFDLGVSVHLSLRHLRSTREGSTVMEFVAMAYNLGLHYFGLRQG